MATIENTVMVVPDWTICTAMDDDGNVWAYDTDVEIEEEDGCWCNATNNAGRAVLVATMYYGLEGWRDSLRKINHETEQVPA